MPPTLASVSKNDMQDEAGLCMANSAGPNLAEAILVPRFPLDIIEGNQDLLVQYRMGLNSTMCLLISCQIYSHP